MDTYKTVLPKDCVQINNLNFLQICYICYAKRQA